LPYKVFTAAEYLCDQPGYRPFPRDALRALPVALSSPLGDRQVVDGATGEALDRFAGA
jgi:hypothetical protein